MPPCKTVSYEVLPTIQPGEPAPDYTQPLTDLNTHLSFIEALLEAQRAQDVEIYSQPGDESNYIGTTQTCTPAATTTVTWTFLPDYVYYFKKVYVDKLPNMAYVWTFQATTERTGEMILEGNVQEFDGKLIKAKGKTTLTLAMTNAGSTAMDHDIIIQSWARRVT